MSAAKRIQNVAIVGATGNVGSYLVSSLLAKGNHTITALARPASTKTPPAGVEVVHVDFDSEDSIASALRGQEFLVITLPAIAGPDMHTRIVAAAVKAGVKYILPNAFSYDITNAKLATEEMYTKDAAGKCKEIVQLGGTFVIMTCGFWYEWSVAMGEIAFGFDVPSRKVTFFDDGKAKIPVSTWDLCGDALAALLDLPESGASPSVSDWANKPLRFASFKVSQRDMLDSLHRVLGTTDADWEIKYEGSADRVKSGFEVLQKGDMSGFVRAMYSSIFLMKDEVDYETSNEVLGLKKEDLDETNKRLVEWIKGGFGPKPGSA